MKLYNMVRKEDVNGISGTGIVAEVCEFSDGSCVVRWIKEATLQNVASTVFYDNQEDLLKVHGHGGKTYLDEICEYNKENNMLLVYKYSDYGVYNTSREIEIQR